MLGPDISNRTRSENSGNFTTTTNQIVESIQNSLGKTYSNSESPLDVSPEASDFCQKRCKNGQLFNKNDRTVTNKLAWLTVTEALESYPNFMKLTQTDLVSFHRIFS